MRRLNFFVAALAAVLFLGSNAHAARPGERTVPINSLLLGCGSSDNSKPYLLINAYQGEAKVLALLEGPSTDRKTLDLGSGQLRMDASSSKATEITVNFTEIPTGKLRSVSLVLENGKWLGGMSTKDSQGWQHQELTCQVLPPYLPI